MFVRFKYSPYLCNVQNSSGAEKSPHKAAIFMPPHKRYKVKCSTAWVSG